MAKKNVMSTETKTLILKADRKYEATKQNQLGFQIEDREADIPVGDITFDKKVTVLKEGGREWLFADMENHPKKVGYEVETWMAIGLVEQDEDLNLVAVHERAGAKRGQVFGA